MDGQTLQMAAYVVPPSDIAASRSELLDPGSARSPGERSVRDDEILV